MAEKVLKVESRTDKGTAASRRARLAGLIPAVVYGHSEPRHILVNRREFNAAFKHISESEIITLQVGKDEVDVLIKDFQSDIVKGEVAHLDFFEIERGKSLRTHVPLHVTGTAAGVRDGGILEASVHELEVECLPKDLPKEIVVDVTKLEAGSAIHVGDIEVPKGVKVLTSEDMVVAAITHAKAASVEAEDSDAEEEAATEE